MKKILLLTPDHLKENGQQLYDQYRTLTKKYEFDFIQMPQDYFQLSLDESRADQLAKDKLQLIKDCDILVVDTNDFRCDNEPMGESAFALGIGFGLKKKCYCYMSDMRNHADRYTGQKHLNSSGRIVDEQDAFFEHDALNLMLYYSATVVQGNFEECLKKIKEEEKCL